LIVAVSPALGEGTQLYVDVKTKQIFAEPGPGRTPFNFVPPTPAAPPSTTVSVAEVKAPEKKS
jgi:hypothetical protein